MQIKRNKILVALLCAAIFSSVPAVGCGSGGGTSTAAVTYAVNFDESNAYYTVVGEERAEKGKDYTFTVEVKRGYAPAENFTVFVNGEAVRAEDGIYTVKDVQGDIEISARNFVVQKYTVNFVAGDTVVQTSRLEYGSLPQFDMSKALPFPKDYADDYVGAFVGWSSTQNGEREDFAKVTGDTDYYAKILKMPRYASIEEVLTVHHTGATQEDTLSKEATLNPFRDAHHPYDGRVWLLVATYEDEICLDYTMTWEQTNFAELLSQDQALRFTFSANYFDYVLTIEDKKIVMDKTIYVVEIYDGALYLNGEKLLQLSSEIYNGERSMIWSVKRATVHQYAQFGFSDVGIVDKSI